MFHVFIENNIHVIPCDSTYPNAIEVNDDIENLYLYHYDPVENNIYKREEIGYELDVREIPYIKFLTNKPFSIDIAFYKEDHYRNIQVDLMTYDVTDEATGKVIDKVISEIGVNAIVDGMIYISPASNNIYFEPIEIHISDKIDNEYEPKMYMAGQVFVLEPSDNYKRLVLLQSDIESLKEEIRAIKGGNEL